MEYDYYANDLLVIGDTTYQIGDKIKDEDVGAFNERPDMLNKVSRVKRETT